MGSTLLAAPVNLPAATQLDINIIMLSAPLFPRISVVGFILRCAHHNNMGEAKSDQRTDTFQEFSHQVPVVVVESEAQPQALH